MNNKKATTTKNKFEKIEQRRYVKFARKTNTITDYCYYNYILIT